MSISINLELEQQQRRVENQPENAICTLRTIELLAIDLGFRSPDELFAYIEGNDILDVGSGYGGLAIDALLRKTQAPVISVNPVLLYDSFEEFQINQIATRRDLFKGFDLPAIEIARRQANSLTYPFFAHNLRFPDHTFGRVLDTFAVFYYANFQDRLAFESSIDEMLRVCKKGGTIRVADPLFKYGEAVPNWKEEILIQKGVRSIPHAFGLEIHKPCT